jgi:hypothetical protein
MQTFSIKGFRLHETHKLNPNSWPIFAYTRSVLSQTDRRFSRLLSTVVASRIISNAPVLIPTRHQPQHWKLYFSNT